VVDLADVSWHPLLASKCSLRISAETEIFEAVTRLVIQIRIFVERVQTEELLSMVLAAIPGVEEE